MHLWVSTLTLTHNDILAIEASHNPPLPSTFQAIRQTLRFVPFSYIVTGIFNRGTQQAEYFLVRAVHMGHFELSHNKAVRVIMPDIQPRMWPLFLIANPMIAVILNQKCEKLMPAFLCMTTEVFDMFYCVLVCINHGLAKRSLGEALNVGTHRRAGPLQAARFPGMVNGRPDRRPAKPRRRSYPFI